MAGRYDRVNGAWEKIRKRYDKISGAWTPVKKHYDKVNGVWVPSYSGAQCKAHAYCGAFNADGSYSGSSTGYLFSLTFDTPIKIIYSQVLDISPAHVNSQMDSGGNKFWLNLGDGNGPQSDVWDADNSDYACVSPNVDRYNGQTYSTFILSGKNMYSGYSGWVDLSFSSGALRINGQPITSVEIV